MGIATDIIKAKQSVDFDAITDVKITEVKNAQLTVGVCLLALQEKKRRGQNCNFEITLPRRRFSE